MLLSVKSIVKAAARTGTASNNRPEVKNSDQVCSGSLYIFMRLYRAIVAKKFTAPAIEDIPAICRLNIAKSTDTP